MGLFDLFRSRIKDERFGHLKVLIALALIDGKIDDTEKGIITAICERERISLSEVEKFIRDYKSIEYIKPTDIATKEKYLSDMVCLMLADGHIKNEELICCKLVAKSFGYHPEVIDAMILDLIRDLDAEDEIKIDI